MGNSSSMVFENVQWADDNGTPSVILPVKVNSKCKIVAVFELWETNVVLSTSPPLKTLNKIKSLMS